VGDRREDSEEMGVKAADKEGLAMAALAAARDNEAMEPGGGKCDRSAVRVDVGVGATAAGAGEAAPVAEAA
jgi:hypothetical protein